MDAEHPTTPSPDDALIKDDKAAKPARKPGDGKVARRGLIAGAAALTAAAAVNLMGAEKAEAAHDPEDLGLGLGNPTAGPAITAQTILTVTVASSAAFLVTNSNPAAGGGGIAAESTPGGFGLRGHSNNVVTFGNVGVIGTASGGGAPSDGGTLHRGVYGSAIDFGVEGRASTGSGVSGDAISGFGTKGRSTNGIGVYGESTNSTGVRGFSGPTGTGAAIGVLGKSGSAAGVRGESGIGPGVSGGSPTGVGVAGFSDSGVGMRGTSQGPGVVGVSTKGVGLWANNATPNVPALFAENVGPSNQLAAVFNGNVTINGALTLSGVKAAIVRMADGSQATMYCQEAPEPFFEDFGRAQLIGGVAQVQLEPEFASLVHLANYMVFPVAEGDCGNLYISRRDQAGFEVRESHGGTSSVPFTYRVVAKRKDIQGNRLARVDPQIERNVAALQAASATTTLAPNPPIPGASGPGSGGGPGGVTVPFTPAPFVPSPNPPSPVVPGPIAPGPIGPGGPGVGPGAR